MLKKTHSALASTETRVAVLAGHPCNEPFDVVLAAHCCPDCDTKVIANNMNIPSCPVCAATMEKQPLSENHVIMSAAELEELTKVATCQHCGTEWRGIEETAQVLQGHKMHCIVCSELMTVSEDVIGDETVDEDLDEDNTSDDIDEDLDESEDDDNLEVDAEAEDELEAEDEELVDIGDELSMEDDSGLDDTELEEDDGESEDVEADLEEEVEDDQMVALEDDITVDDESDTEETTMASVKTNPLQHVLANMQDAELELVATGGENLRWYLFANEQPIAIASFERASEKVQKIFNNQRAFTDAFRALAESEITEESISEMGFQPAIVDVPVDEAAKQHINNAVEEQTAALKKKTDEVIAHFEQCLGIAITGINKGAFGNENSFVLAMVDELSKNNVRQPEKLAYRLIEDKLPQFFKDVVAKTMELMTKEVDNLNDIANIVSTASFRHIPSGDSDSKQRTIRNMPLSVSASTYDEGTTRSSGGQDFKRLVSSISRRNGL